MPLSELNQDPSGALAVQPVLGFEGGREETALLGHGSFLGLEEVALIGVQDEHAAHRKEDQKNVESEESEGDAG